MCSWLAAAAPHGDGGGAKLVAGDHSAAWSPFFCGSLSRGLEGQAKPDAAQQACGRMVGPVNAPNVSSFPPAAATTAAPARRLAPRPLYCPEMLWRTPSRSRRSLAAGFIQPAQPMLVVKPRGGPEWIHEVKHDGYRLLARKSAGRVVLWSRHGADLTDNMPRIAEAVGALPVADALLDGEAVVFRPDGRSDFAALRTKRGAAEASFVAFDLLHVDGEDRRKLALEVRRAELAALVAGIDATIAFSKAIDAEGAVVFAKACELGVEDIVSKRLGSVYLSGPCRNWLEVKNPAFLRG
jgi:bifunctional non-homologous end joining protein LigD